jgi:hypothetical protein
MGSYFNVSGIYICGFEPSTISGTTCLSQFSTVLRQSLCILLYIFCSAKEAGTVATRRKGAVKARSQEHLGHKRKHYCNGESLDAVQSVPLGVFVILFGFTSLLMSSRSII